MASLGEHHLDRNGPIFHRGGLVLDGDGGQWWPLRCRAQIAPGPGRVADLKARDGGDPDEASPDTRRPALSIRACCQSYQCRLVDEPGGYCHAADITSGSAKSSKMGANKARSATLTVTGTRAASYAGRSRRYSLRQKPGRPAW